MGLLTGSALHSNQPPSYTAIRGQSSRYRVEPRLGGTPPGAAVERDPLVGGDVGLGPVGEDLRVGAHRVVDVPVVLHVVRVRPAIAPHVALDPARWPDVVVAADRADVLPPGPDADERRTFLIGQDLLRLGQVDEIFGMLRDRDTETATGSGVRGTVSSG